MACREEREERRQKRQKKKQGNKKKTKDTKNNKDNNEKRQDNNQAIQIPELPGEVRQVLNDFHNKYKEAPIEHSYLVDTKTGQIHDHSIGENRSVRPNWDAIPKGRQAIVIHNPHTRPQGILVTYDPLSNTDIKQLLSKPNVPYMIATNQHRTQIAKYYGAMPDIDS